LLEAAPALASGEHSAWRAGECDTVEDIYSQSLKIWQVRDHDLGNTLRKVISSLLKAAPELASGEATCGIASLQCRQCRQCHLTSEFIGRLPIHMHMLSGGGAPIQIIESVTSEAKIFKHALADLPNMKFRPGRVTNAFFLRFLL
jgi:hypothetical protein